MGAIRALALGFTAPSTILNQPSAVMRFTIAPRDARYLVSGDFTRYRKRLRWLGRVLLHGLGQSRSGSDAFAPKHATHR